MMDERVGVAAGEFARFAVVGATSNVALFCFYLLLTHLGAGHKLAATIAYASGVLGSFIFNRSWSFKYAGAPGPALRRYISAYLVGYALNILGLLVLVDLAGANHQWVQGAMIIIVAAMVFWLQKVWVFR